MKKRKILFTILIVFLVFIFFNIVYYFIVNWQNFFSRKNSLSSETANLKTFSSVKMGLEVKYPASWILQENDTIVEINPPGAGNSTYFSIGQRSDFSSLEEIKRKLAADIPITPIQINNASGFKYLDSDFLDSIWLLHSNKIYIIRIYPISEQANQILTTLKFSD